MNLSHPDWCFFLLLSLEIVRAMTHVINQGMAMYWGTSRWTAMEIMVSSVNFYTHCYTLTLLISVYFRCTLSGLVILSNAVELMLFQGHN